MFNTIKSLFGKLFTAKDHGDCQGCQTVEQDAKHTAVMSAPYKVEPPQMTPIQASAQATIEPVKKTVPAQKAKPASPSVKAVKKKTPAKKTTKKVTK
jgi:hypothetical protein